MKKSEESIELHIHPREKETVSIDVPKDVLESLEKVAKKRDMSIQALIKFYIGQGLRHDLYTEHTNHPNETAPEILAKQNSS